MAEGSSMSESQACQWCRENCSRIHMRNAQTAATSAPLSFYKIMTETMVDGKTSPWVSSLRFVISVSVFVLFTEVISKVSNMTNRSRKWIKTKSRNGRKGRTIKRADNMKSCRGRCSKRKSLQKFLVLVSLLFLPLPTSVVQKCAGTVGTVTLKGPSSQEWQVGISGTRDGCIGFRSGWKAFSCHHNLTKGDVLFFWRIAESCFHVQIFDKDGCDKHTAFENSNITSCKSEQSLKKRKGLDVQSDVNISKKSGKGKIQSRHYNTYSKKLGSEYCAKGEANRCNNPAVSSVIKEETANKDNSAFSVQEKLFYTSFSEGMGEPVPEYVVRAHSAGAQSLSSAELPNGVESQRNDEINNPADKHKMHKVCHGGDNIMASLIKDQKHHLQMSIVSQRRPVTELEKKKTIEEAQAHKSHKPLARVIMRESHVYRGFRLTLPFMFVKKWFPTESEKVALVDSTGREFYVNWLGSNRRNNPSLSGGGWRKFALTHGLEEGDVCVFELRCKNPIRLRVYIYQVVEPVTREDTQNAQISAKCVAEKRGANMNKKVQLLEKSFKFLKQNYSKELKSALQKTNSKLMAQKLGSFFRTKKQSIATKEEVETAEDLMKCHSQMGHTFNRVDPEFIKKSISDCQAEDGVTPHIDNEDEQIGHNPSTEALAKCSQAQKKATHMANQPEKKALVPELSVADASGRSSGDLFQRAMLASYKVERLIGRRVSKGSMRTEFLVQLENTLDTVQIKSFEKQGNGVWWVPFSHFTEDLVTCHD